MTLASDPTAFTLAEARDAIRSKAISARELASAHVSAITSARRLNAFITETPDHALAAADLSDKRVARGEARPLEGLPLAIKDLFCTKGVRTTAASRILENFVPTYESTVTRNLWDAGAVLLGKTNLDEFAMGSSNESSHFGPAINPWRARGSNSDLVPGDSPLEQHPSQHGLDGIAARTGNQPHVSPTLAFPFGASNEILWSN